MSLCFILLPTGEGEIGFTSAKHALEDVRLRRLKIATLPDINDPFELAVCCDGEMRRRALRRTRLEWANRFGMLCFSRGWHNPVQWSHYADKHWGICLGFDVPDEMLTPIMYAEEPPDLDWDAIEHGSSEGESEMLRWSSTKYSHWVYEDEVRAFLSLDECDAEGRYFSDFGEQLRLRQIIVGAQSAVTRHEVKLALDGLDGVGSFKARLAFGGYRVVTQRDQSRWR